MNTCSAKIVNKCTIPGDRVVTTISLARNGKGIAVAVLGDRAEGEVEPKVTLPPYDMAAKSRIIASHVKLARDKFPKENTENPGRLIYVVTTFPELLDVAIVYIDRGRRLFVSGVLGPSRRQRLWSFWDTVSLQNKAFDVWWYSEPFYRSLPLQIFKHGDVVGVAMVHSFPSGLPSLGVITSTGTLLGSFATKGIISGVSYRGSLAFIQCDILFRFMQNENRWSHIEEQPQADAGRRYSKGDTSGISNC